MKVILPLIKFKIEN